MLRIKETLTGTEMVNMLEAEGSLAVLRYVEEG